MVKGYKVFNPDWTCRDFRYEVGKTYEQDGALRVCGTGFHFCFKASDCFNYYSFDPKNKVAEVIAHGEVVSKGDKSCTNKIEIVREIPWVELLAVVNGGTGNSGYRNSGDWNSGDWNTGNRNSGYRNSGDWNTGNRNSGYWNTGNRNSGYWNTGNRNSGDWNSGYWNSGDWNSANYSSGVFCTETPKILIFDKPSDWTLNDWRNSNASYLLNNIQIVFWICDTEMTDQEKELYPEHETTGGYLKTVSIVEAAEKWWDELTEADKQTIRNIPNFDKEKFYQITGIKA